MEDKKHYLVKVYSFDVDRDGYAGDCTISEIEKIYYGTSIEGLDQKVKEVATKYKANFGEGFEVTGWSAELDDDYCEGDDIFDYLEEIEEVVERVNIDYEYKSLSGAIIIEWQWDTHVGYARKFEYVRIGRSNEDESLLIDVDLTYRTQFSVLAYPDELTGDKEKDLRKCISEALDMGMWNNEHALIKELHEWFNIEMD